MNKKTASTLLFFIFFLLSEIPSYAYKNFKVSVYCRAYEVKQMNNIEWLDSLWNVISSQVYIDKVYLETHRDGLIVEKSIVEKAKKYFHDQKVEVAGGITYTIDESNYFETYCYSNPEHRKKVKEIAEYTASLFDEVILDDFFFTSCKCDLCVAAKGDQSWTEYRLKLMYEAGRNLIVKPAKAVNPKVKIVIKYPNWYEHFQGLGFNLETEPGLFDGIYTGTETRDPVFGNQHLQQYESYLIFRYFENLKPGGNGGGWVDPFGVFYMDRYSEQLWLTALAKAPEITLFDIRSIQRPVDESLKAQWQNGTSGFDYDEMVKYSKLKNKNLSQPNFSSVAGYTFLKADVLIGKLGKPVGVKSYKPYHSSGEDFLQNYIGMAGVPMDIVPEFPESENMVFLTESAAFDKEIVKKIKKHLLNGKNVMITSGLLKALQDKGLKDIAEINYSYRKSLVSEFLIGRNEIHASKDDILIPQIEYLTNDSWEMISGMDAGLGWPFLHMAAYNRGKLYVLTIPENFADIYNLPTEVLTVIKKVLAQNMIVRLDAPGKVSLFVFDNNTFVIQSFLDEPVQIKIASAISFNKITDLESGKVITGKEIKSIGINRKPITEKSFETTINPHSFSVFKIE